MNNIAQISKSAINIITNGDGSKTVQITAPTPDPITYTSDQINEQVSILLSEQASFQKNLDRVNDQLALLQPLQDSLK